jgi:hypothetical protein
LEKLELNVRFTVVVRRLPEDWTEEPVPLSVHWELETLAACPGVI